MVHYWLRKTGHVICEIPLQTQVYSIIGAFHWDVPTGLKPPKGTQGISDAGLGFWLINLTPIVAGLVYLGHLSKDKQYEIKKNQTSKNRKSK